MIFECAYPYSVITGEVHPEQQAEADTHQKRSRGDMEAEDDDEDDDNNGAPSFKRTKVKCYYHILIKYKIQIIKSTFFPKRRKQKSWKRSLYRWKKLAILCHKMIPHIRCADMHIIILSLFLAVTSTSIKIAEYYSGGGRASASRG